MAEGSEYDIDFEELERLFIDDTTDEQFSFDENEAISEPSLSGKDSFLSTNVSFSSLKLVLDRLADRQTNLWTKSGQLPRSFTGKKCIFQYGKSLENSMFEYPTLDNHWEIYSVPIKVQLFSNTGKMLFIHDLAAGVSLEVYWRTTHLVFQCWTMM